MTHEQLAIENFVYWLLHTSPERFYKHRTNIGNAVKLFGKKRVLDEIIKQGKDSMKLSEALSISRIITEIESTTPPEIL